MSEVSVISMSGVPTLPTRRLWVGPALVALAVASLLFWVTVFVRTPLNELPLYFAGRYFVLDATSMLFLLVIDSVFLGISVYMSSRVGTSRLLADNLLPRAALTLAFMVAMNLGVLANNLLLLWASPPCARHRWWRRATRWRRGAWPGTTCCTRACRWHSPSWGSCA